MSGQRRLAAIMFTDMVGYTSLSQKNEPLAMELLEEHRSIVRPFILKHNGNEIKTIGDAFLVEFASALEAVRCAFDIQQSFHEMNSGRPMDRRIQLRIGVHLGDIIRAQNDVYGDAVNVASRIEPLSESGGITVTAQVHDQVKNKFEFPFNSLGKKPLKNVGEEAEIFKIVLPWDNAKDSGSNLDRHRVAVLPFVNMSPDPNDEYFADGLTEELIDRLCHVRGLEVIARTSIMSYKKKNVKAADIGRELRAGALVEGSVRKAGNRIRVTAQLINASSEGHLWSSKYDRDFNDIFAVQTDIAEQVARALEVQLLPGEKRAIEQKRTESTDAYTLYLKGRQLWNRRTRDSVYAAVDYFDRACAIDPSFALAYVGKADCYSVMDSYGYESAATTAPKAKESVMKALNLDDELAEAHATYGQVLAMYEWRWSDAELEFKKAIDLNPNYATAHQWYAYSVLRFNRRVDEEMREVERALELDPLAPVMSLNKAQSLYLQERYDETADSLNHALRIDPDFLPASFMTALLRLVTGHSSEAIGLYKQVLPRSGMSMDKQKLYWVFVYGTAGQEKEARDLLAEVKESSDPSVSPTDFAAAYRGLGETEKMFEFLEQACLRKDPGLPFLLSGPVMKSFKSDTRLVRLMKNIGI